VSGTAIEPLVSVGACSIGHHQKLRLRYLL
jgi:hypothetical protein